MVKVMNADQATKKMVEAMVRDSQMVDEEVIVFDHTHRYMSAQIENSLPEAVFQDEARRTLHQAIGKMLMNLLHEADEPLAVWLREVRIPIGYNNSNGGVRVIVETIPLRKVL